MTSSNNGGALDTKYLSMSQPLQWISDQIRKIPNAIQNLASKDINSSKR